MNFTVQGKITQHEGEKLTINTEENVVFHVRYDEKTKISGKNGGPVTDKDLQVGAEIKVDGDLSESGEIYARTIEVE